MTAASVDPHVLALLNFTDAHLRHTAALARATGEHFNVFQILRVGHYEVRTHSPMLAELLNPKGSHGQGGGFLRLFCTAVGIEGFDPESASVRTEYHIGPQTEEEGGRIDILISDRGGCQIIIENKIHAAEQRNQLGRYRKYSARAHLFFLTLFGNDSQDADGSNSAAVTNISYRNHIVLWLEACRKEAVNAPTVRETITQYIHLIQQLTHQNTDTRMSQELTAAVLRDEATYLAYSALCKAERTVQKTILTKFKRDLEPKSNQLGLRLNFSESELTNRHKGFWFTNAAMDEQEVRITLQFGEGNLGACMFGFSRLAPDAVCPAEVALFEAFRTTFPGARKSPQWWVALVSWEQHSHWGATTMAAIQFGNAFAAEVMGIVEKMIGVFNTATQRPAPSN